MVQVSFLNGHSINEVLSNSQQNLQFAVQKYCLPYLQKAQTHNLYVNTMNFVTIKYQNAQQVADQLQLVADQLLEKTEKQINEQLVSLNFTQEEDVHERKKENSQLVEQQGKGKTYILRLTNIAKSSVQLSKVFTNQMLQKYQVQLQNAIKNQEHIENVKVLTVLATEFAQQRLYTPSIIYIRTNVDLVKNRVTITADALRNLQVQTVQNLKQLNKEDVLPLARQNLQKSFNYALVQKDNVVTGIKVTLETYKKYGAQIQQALFQLLENLRLLELRQINEAQLKQSVETTKQVVNQKYEQALDIYQQQKNKFNQNYELILKIMEEKKQERKEAQNKKMN